VEFLIYEQDGPVVTLTMNQPEKRNPLSGNSSLTDFVEAIERIHDDNSVRCVIVTGNGPSFSSGGDIGVLRSQASPDVTEMNIRQQYRRGIQRVAVALLNLEVPVVAALNGHAIGAGLGLACMCDIRIASDRAKMAAGFIKLGIIPGDGGTWLLPRIIGMSRAAELYLTGDVIDAQKALEWSLVSQVVAHDGLMTAARDLAGRIAQNPSHTVRLTKRLMREAMRSPFETVLELSAVYQAVSHKTADHTEAVDAFLEKREPQFTSRL
jgi:enoyl-CoA hydratase/carnithine racemase